MNTYHLCDIMMSKIIIAIILLIVGLGMLTLGNYILYDIYAWLNWSSDAINPKLMPISGLVLMGCVVGYIIFLFKQEGNSNGR